MAPGISQLWQVASGAEGRNYAHLCSLHDVMLIGPGDRGEYRRTTYADEPMGPQIRSFVEGPRPDDIVLLRKGHAVVNVGKIPPAEVGGYEWNDAFADVLGWPLQHTRRVIWDESALAILPEPHQIFANYKQQKTFTAVHESRFAPLIPALSDAIPDRLLADLPKVSPALTLEEVGLSLFEAGLSNDSVEKVIEAIERTRRLIRWYRTHQSGSRPSEMETVAHIIVPLLLALGWSEQLVGLEWNKVDLVLFDRTPTTVDNCVVICEAKRPGRGLDEVLAQARSYVQRLNLVRCRRILLTDGERILVYTRVGSDWPETPDGYVNLSMIRTHHLLPPGRSAIAAIMDMMPARNYAYE
jgi:hypothetical protein